MLNKLIPILDRHEVIYLDMDGVLCDLDGALNERGITRRGRAMASFTASADADFWEALPAYPWTRELIALVNTYPRVVIITSPGKSPDCRAGKIRWLHANGLGHHDLVFSMQGKHRFSHPGAILIDDNFDNAVGFLARGGSSIMWRQPWTNGDWCGVRSMKFHKFDPWAKEPD